ncbi:hypothetical protein [uncultured Croceitalea sp.]
MAKEKEYTGIWRDIGCLLSAVAILGIIAVILIFIYQLVSGS